MLLLSRHRHEALWEAECMPTPNLFSSRQDGGSTGAGSEDDRWHVEMPDARKGNHEMKSPTFVAEIEG
jgi:hypothetical protein